jgi:hypothetical protein
MDRLGVTDYDSAGTGAIKLTDHRPKQRRRKNPNNKKHDHRQPQPNAVWEQRLPSANERSEHPPTISTLKGWKKSPGFIG